MSLLSVVSPRRCRAVAAVAALVMGLAGCITVPLELHAPVAGVRQTQRLQPVAWSDLPGWQNDDLNGALAALQFDCRAMARRAEWARICAAMPAAASPQTLRGWFEQYFSPYRLANDDGSRDGLITGYYAPILHGSRTRHGRYQTPLHRFPDGLRGQKLPTRAELLASGVLRGHELVWVDDPVEAAFLQIQGAGRIELDDGTAIRVGYAGTNDWPYKSFGSWLLARGELTPAQATMQGIKQWARSHPERADQMLNVNPRYVFFRQLPDDGAGPPGALGVPLIAERSVAVDPGAIPLGTPVWLATTRPLSAQPLQRLVFAQDVGSAIRGVVRADYFWGLGDAAGDAAGRMKQSGQLWLLLPKNR